MKKYVLFDMDGTVLDTLQDLHDSINYSLAHFGYPQITIQESAANLGNGAVYLMQHSAPEGLSEEKLTELLDFYKPWYEKHCRIKTGPFPGIPELMEDLKSRGIRLAVVSNKPHGAAKELADEFFGDILDYAQGEESSVRRKPAPDMVWAAMKALGASPEESVYVGDTEVDIQTAAAAGIDEITVTWGFRSRESLVSAYDSQNIPESRRILCSSCSELLDAVINM